MYLGIPLRRPHNGGSASPPLEGTMSSPDIRHVTDDTFDPEVLKSDVPVLVDYWAEWCGPCKSIAPILDEVAKEYDGRLKIAKVNFAGTERFSSTFTLAIFSRPSYSFATSSRIGAIDLHGPH